MASRGCAGCGGTGWRSLSKKIPEPSSFYFFGNMFTILGYNFHALQFIHLKCVIQWFLACSQGHITITSNSGTSHHPREQHCPHQQSPPAPSPAPDTPNPLSVSVDAPVLDIPHTWSTCRRPLCAASPSATARPRWSECQCLTPFRGRVTFQCADSHVRPLMDISVVFTLWLL